MDTRDRLRLVRTRRRGRLLSTDLPFLLLAVSNPTTTLLPSHRYLRKLQHLLEELVSLLEHHNPPPIPLPTLPPSTNSLLLGARQPLLFLLLPANPSLNPTLNEDPPRWELHQDRDTPQDLFQPRTVQAWESLDLNRARRRDLNLPFTHPKITTLLLFLLLTTTSMELSTRTEVLSTRTKAAGRLKVPTVLEHRQEETVLPQTVPSLLGTSTRLPQSTDNLNSIPTTLLIPTVPKETEEEEQPVSALTQPNLSLPSPSPPPVSPNEPSPPSTVSLSTTLPLDSTPLPLPLNPTSIQLPSPVQPSSQQP